MGIDLNRTKDDSPLDERHGLRMNEQLDKVDEIIPKDQKEFRV